MVMMTIILPSVLFSAISHSLALDGSSSLRAPVDTVRLVFFFYRGRVIAAMKPIIFKTNTLRPEPSVSIKEKNLSITLIQQFG